MDKPVVAAMHGTPLGGGLEVALGCHFRRRAPRHQVRPAGNQARLIPGAGGTQRLPRLIGMDKAIAMILPATPIAAPDARDWVCSTRSSRVTSERRPSISPAKSSPSGVPYARVRDDDAQLAEFIAAPARFEELAAPYLKRARGQQAPAGAVAALRCGARSAVRRGAGARARDLRRPARGRAIQGAAACLLRRARGSEAHRPATVGEAARGQRRRR